MDIGVSIVNLRTFPEFVHIDSLVLINFVNQPVQPMIGEEREETSIAHREVLRHAEKYNLKVESVIHVTQKS